MVQQVTRQGERTESALGGREGGSLDPKSLKMQDDDDRYTHRMIFLISAPLIQFDSSNRQSNIPTLNVWSEIDAIINSCLEAEVNVDIQIEVKFATSKEIRRLSQYNSPLIIHFIGHGIMTNSSTALLLEDANGVARNMSVQELQEILKSSSNPCKILFLNACYSEKLGEIFAGHADIPHVISISHDKAIRDTAARIFSGAFYPNLLKGNTVANSFIAGYQAVRHDDQMIKELGESLCEPASHEQSKIFQLIPIGSHNQKINLHKSTGTVLGPKWTNTNLSQVSSSPFVGRQYEMYKVIRALHEDNSRCILMHGFGGIGKTSLADAVGRWVHERKNFRDGVWKIELRSTSSISDARVQIVEQIINHSSNKLDLSLNISKSNQKLASGFSDSSILLILDDVDNLLDTDKDGISKLINSLLSCRKIKLIVTSRSIFPTSIMCYLYETPKMTGEAPILTFNTYAFSDKAEEYRLYDASVQQNIIDLLDGYPFAIRLAASYIRRMQCNLTELWDKLRKKPLETLKDPHTAPPNRDTSLKITLDVSYDALSPTARKMFQHLGFFPAGISKNMVKSIFGDNEALSLEELSAFSMAEQHVGTDGEMRFSLPEPARFYAEAQCESGELAKIAISVLLYYCDFVEDRVNMLFLSQNDEHTA
jgi:hypothetical protein